MIQIVRDGHSVLCFCSSRKGCESTAKHISKFLNEFSSSKLDHDNEFSDVFSVIEALRKSPVGLDPTLEETLPHGVAYHHAGLTVSILHYMLFSSSRNIYVGNWS